MSLSQADRLRQERYDRIGAVTPNNRDTKQRYRLMGEICPEMECRALIFPPRDICPRCGKDMFREKREEEWKRR